MRDIEDFLQRSGVRWRAIHRPSDAAEDPRSTRARSDATAGRPLERPWLRLVGIAVLLPLVVVVALVVNHGSRSAPAVSSGSGRAGPVAVAGPPLLTRLPASTPPVQVAAGMADGAAWSLWAKISPLDRGRTASSGPGASGGSLPTGEGSLPTFGPGLDMQVVTPRATGGGGGDPTRMDALLSSTYGPTRGFDAELVYGVTSARAAAVHIVFSGSTRTLNASIYDNSQFPGLRFFTAVAPASASGDRVVAEAFGPDGAPLLETAPARSSPAGR